MKPRIRPRKPASIGSNQASPENSPSGLTAVVLSLSMAWSPPARQRRALVVESQPETTSPLFQPHPGRDRIRTLTFLVMWVTGLLSLAVLGAGVYILWAWYQGEIQSQVWLTVGILILLWSAVGSSVTGLLRRRGTDEPRAERRGRAHRIPAPD